MLFPFCPWKKNTILCLYLLLFYWHHYRALVDSKTSSTDDKEGSKDRTESMQLGDELQMGGTTSGGESGGSPITVLRMQMQDEVKKETETQTEKQAIEDKETTITAEELNEMAGKECRETQVTHILNKRFVHIYHFIAISGNNRSINKKIMLSTFDSDID